MKKLFIIALLGLSTQANAACAALDYEEMKDMSTPELTKTFCEYNDKWQHDLTSLIAYGGSDVERAEIHGCEAQVKRMERILKKREDGNASIMKTCPQAF